MKAIVTGSCGLVGYATCRRLLSEGWQVTGIDNDQRGKFFGPAGSTCQISSILLKNKNYRHELVDVRNCAVVASIIREGTDLIIHCAAQPSHDYAAAHLWEDFSINAVATLQLLNDWKQYCGKTVPFIHVSTSKVYGDNPNRLCFIEQKTRWELPSWHQYYTGIPESFSVDQCLHSFFGVSKLSGDLLAQEFGRYYNLPVGVFRPGCITGGHHRGVELHGFLQYLMACVYSGREYTIYGYRGKQVRCNVHADDLVNAFLLYANSPKPGAVYNVGGRPLDCSMMEAISACEERCGRKAITSYVETPRIGDHQWWISDATRLREELQWRPKRSLSLILDELYAGCTENEPAPVGQG